MVLCDLGIYEFNPIDCLIENKNFLVKHDMQFQKVFDYFPLIYEEYFLWEKSLLPLAT